MMTMMRKILLSVLLKKAVNFPDSTIRNVWSSKTMMRRRTGGAARDVWVLLNSVSAKKSRSQLGLGVRAGGSVQYPPMDGSTSNVSASKNCLV